MKSGETMDTFYAKVETYNLTSDDKAFNTITVKTEDSQLKTIAIDANASVKTGEVYRFTVTPNEDDIRERPLVSAFTHFYDLTLKTSEKESIMRHFYDFAPLAIEKIQTTVESYLARIENPAIKTITETLFRRKEDDFYLYPAATRFHHAYIGGVAYHTMTMLKLVDGLVATYPYLNEELLIAGIILHDLYKIGELSNYHAPNYTKEGKLIGHLVMGSEAIGQIAREQGVYDTEERLLLQHMLLTHHYYGNFGSPKKPNIPEALALHFIDNIDSKFAVLGEALKQTKKGEFTQSLGVLDRERYYKAKGNK